MKHPLSLFAPERLVPALFAALSLLLSGCASFQQDTCAQFEEHGKEADYSTKYVYSNTDSEAAAENFKPLPRGRSAAVRLYRMNLAPAKINPCSYLTIRKDIYLQRAAQTGLVLEEIRQFYTADGALIATKTESIGDQLRTTGYYTGDTLLPIPPKAPPGKYRIVSKLVLKTKYKHKQRLTVLAGTSANFEIVSRRQAAIR